MKITITGQELGCIVKMISAAGGMSFIKQSNLFDMFNISYAEFAIAIGSNSPLEIEIEEKDVIIILETYGDFFIDIAPMITGIIRSAERFQRALSQMEITEPPTFKLGEKIIEKRKME